MSERDREQTATLNESRPGSNNAVFNALPGITADLPAEVAASA